MKSKAITLDGPSGAGKSTLAKRVGERFDYIYVDTGALYRSIGLFMLRNGVGSKDENGVAALLPNIMLEIKYDNEGIQRMLLNGEDVTDAIRTPEASLFASDVSAMPAVRDFLLSMQRDLAATHNVIMDGRDIGTVVLPDAWLKIFLIADAEVRAGRRYKELTEKKIDVTFEEVLRDINKRDLNDSNREAAPLKAADDAVILDTTELSFEESYEAICAIVSGRLESER